LRRQRGGQILPPHAESQRNCHRLEGVEGLVRRV
jgi:hypothetical protein